MFIKNLLWSSLLFGKKSGSRRALSASAMESDGRGGLRLLFGGDSPAVTIVWLHGLGDTGRGWADIFGPTSFVSVPSDPFKVLLPTAPTQGVTINGGMAMPSWYDIYGLDRNSEVDREGLAVAVERIRAMVDAEKCPVVLGGFSQGGAVALTTALRCDMPNLIGVVAASSYLPLANDYQRQDQTPNSRVPFLVCHGDADQVVNFEFGKASAEKISSIGLQCEFKPFPGLVHSARPDELEAIQKFVLDAVAAHKS